MNFSTLFQITLALKFFLAVCVSVAVLWEDFFETQINKELSDIHYEPSTIF